MPKLFTFAGTCIENGATVYKFANDAKRAKALERFGCTDVNLIELPEAMDKDAAVAFLATKGITAAKAPKVAKTVKVTKKAKDVAAKATETAKEASNDEVTKEEWGKAMAEREANDMPTVSFAQYKRDAAKVKKFFERVEEKLAAKRAEGKIPF